MKPPLYLLLGVVSLVTARRRAHTLPSQYRRYVDGPNICAVQEVFQTGQKFFTSCVGHKFLRVICERPTFVSFSCCPGFRRIPGERGCTGVSPVEDIVETLGNLRQTEFAKYAQQAGLEDQLKTGGAYTVFVPNNKAFHQASPDVKQSLAPADRGERSTLLYHMVSGRVNITSLRRGAYEHSTLYGDKTLMLNKYAHGAMTVNCARIERPDELATNGIIHVIDGVLKPVEVDKSLSDKVFADDDYAQFQLALFMADMANELRREDVKYTVFAPTNKAFAKLPSDMLDAILTDADTARKVVKNHIVEGVYCQDAIVIAMGLKTQTGQRILMRCKRDGTYFSTGKVVDGDNVVSNGVLHGIDEVVLPQSVKDIPDVAKDMRLKTFVDLAEKARLTDRLRSKEDITVMVPTDKAFEKLPPKYLAALKTQPLTMEKLIDYHTVKGKLTTDQLVGNNEVETKLGPSAKIKVNVFRGGVTVNSAKVVGREAVCGNGVIHKIDTVLLPPEDTLMAQIIMDPSLSTLRQAVETAGLTQFLSTGGQKTLLAPTNRAFESMSNRILNQLMTNPNRLKKFLDRHLINRLVVECAIPEKAQYNIRSNQGDRVTFTKDSHNNVKINRKVRAKVPDQLATNGILYKMDDVLKCSCEPRIR